VATGPDEKRTMNKNSLANLTPGRKNKNLNNPLTDAFKEDILAFWTKKTKGKAGKTKGQELLEEAAEKNPMQFVKTVAGLLPPEINPDAPSARDSSLKDFATVLQELNASNGNAREVPEDTVIDIKPFEGEADLPITLDGSGEDEVESAPITLEE
jgi:hypothetical protein